MEILLIWFGPNFFDVWVLRVRRVFVTDPGENRGFQGWLRFQLDDVPNDSLAR